MKPVFPQRPRRNRKNSAIRDLVAETQLSTDDLVFPIFIKEGTGRREPIGSMPGQYRYTLDILMEQISKWSDHGLRYLALFPAIDEDKKDANGSESAKKEGLACQSLLKIKEKFPHITLIADIALDPFTNHGHDGLLDKEGNILNDETLDVLSKMAVAYSECGADMVAPSDMMDGRVGCIRNSLDEAGFSETSILSYCAKYASNFYGPFRDALQSAPKSGDKKTYQMDFRNRREALWEMELDEQEGADILMVKPAMPYLDVIADLSANSHLPIAAYQVSCEYAMLCAAGHNSWLNLEECVVESLTSIKRAGAKIIFSYFTVGLLLGRLSE